MNTTVKAGPAETGTRRNPTKKSNRSPLEPAGKTLLVAYHAGREIVRDRAVELFFILSLLTIACSYLLKSAGGPAGPGNGLLLIDLDLTVIHVFGGFTAILVGAGLISRELAGRTAWLTLSRPISRTGFLLGKYLGLLALLGLFLLVMFAAIVGVLRLAGLPFPPGLFLSALLIYAEFWLLGALALFFSVWAPVFPATLLTIIFFVLGHLTPALKLLASRSENLPARWGSTVAYYLFPNLRNFDPGLPGLAAPPDVLLGFGRGFWTLVYGLGVTALFLALSAVIFNKRREFP